MSFLNLKIIKLKKIENNNNRPLLKICNYCSNHTTNINNENLPKIIQLFYDFSIIISPIH